MEANRLAVSDILRSIMEECGEEPRLYFQPPESVKLEYPCVIYRLSTMTNSYADDKPYSTKIAYDVTYITRASNSKVPSRIVKEPFFGFDRYYTADSLHHYAYRVTSTLKEVFNG